MKRALLFLNACILFQGMTFAMEDQGMKEILELSTNCKAEDSDQPIMIQGGKKILEFVVLALAYEGIRKIVRLSSQTVMQETKPNNENKNSSSNQQQNNQPNQSQTTRNDEIKPGKMEIEDENEPIFQSQNSDQNNKSNTENFDTRLADSVWNNCPAELKSEIEEYTNTYQNVTNEARRNLLRTYYQKKLIREILLVGPPGTGKSTLAKVIASKINYPFIFIKCSSLGDIYQNSGAQNLSRQFEPFLNSGQKIVLILDEISAIMEKPDSKQKTEKANTAIEFWSLLDQCNHRNNILVIMTTNTIDEFPPALKSRLSNSTFHIQTSLNLDYKKGILNIHAITPINWDCQWYQFWSRYNNWSLLRSLQRRSPRDIQKIAELASKLAKERFIKNSDAHIEIMPSDVSTALTCWNNNIINQPEPSEAFINWKGFLVEGLKQTPSIIFGATQVAGSLYLQHDMNKKSLNQSKEFSDKQYKLSEQISHQQLDQSNEHAQKQLEQNKEHHDEALGKNKSNMENAKDIAWDMTETVGKGIAFEVGKKVASDPKAAWETTKFVGTLVKDNIGCRIQ